MTLEAEPEQFSLSIKGAGSRSKITGMDAQEFPPMYDPYDSGYLFPDIASVLQFVSYAVSTDEARPSLQGVYFNIEGIQATIAATDGYRIAELITKAWEPFIGIIPISGLKAASKLPTVSYRVNEGSILFSTDDTLIRCNLIDGNFPDYKQIIPKKFNIRITVGTDPLIKAIQSAMITADGPFITLESSEDLQKLIVSGAGETAECETQIEAIITAPIKVNFNGNYLLDALKANGRIPTVWIDVNDEKSPVSIAPGTNQNNRINIVMPVHK